MGSVPNWYQIGNKTYYVKILCRKRITMLIGLKVSSLSCKYVILHTKGAPMELNLKILKCKNEIYQRRKLQ